MAIRKEAAYTVEDVAAMENHCELINRELVVTDRTSTQHQRFIRRIAGGISDFLRKNNRSCELFTENLALFCNELDDMSDGEFYLPDIMVVCDPSGIKDDGVHTAPLFVAEVTSEATRRNDYYRKFITYSRIGVTEYAVIDLQKNVMVRYQAQDGYVPEYFRQPDYFEAAVFTGLKINIADLW
ncbi:MAG: Uma2 family endonuclease [Bilifractor sp.]|jgi:Uma2 family endonuclease